jgi:metallopeptidase MepB
MHGVTGIRGCQTSHDGILVFREYSYFLPRLTQLKLRQKINMTRRIPPQQPPRMLSAEEILPTTQKVLDRDRAARNAVVHDVTPLEACFRNVIKPLIDVDNQNNAEKQVIAMLRYASPSKECREASEAAIKLLGECWSEFTAREEIFLLIKAVHDRGETLDFESAKYLDNLMKDFKRCGHGLLSGSQIKQYLETRNQIDDLRQEYNRNIREEDDGIWLSREDLDGVPDEDMARFGTEQGRQQLRYIHFRHAEIDSVLKFATKSSTREKIYIANAYRLPQNVDLFKRIILLRDQNARLLGYSSHATFRLEKRVAKTVEWVSDLFEGLEKTLLPKGKQEIQELLQLKKDYIAEHGEKDDYMDTVTPWDYAFYTRLALDSLKVDHERISEYFPLQHSISAMLDIFASCLQLKFIPAPSELVSGSIWHEDVEAWCVWDEREASIGSFIGYLFTDLLWRPGKYKGSQNVNLQCVRLPLPPPKTFSAGKADLVPVLSDQGYVKDDGTRVYPATVLMCCFPRATSSNCTLLKHREIVSIFHGKAPCTRDDLKEKSD